MLQAITANQWIFLISIICIMWLIYTLSKILKSIEYSIEDVLNSHHNEQAMVGSTAHNAIVMKNKSKGEESLKDFVQRSKLKPKLSILIDEDQEIFCKSK